MSFIVIQGAYHLVNRTAAGRETGFEPDGDSIHFRPADRSQLDRLRRIRNPYRLTTIGSLQLRLEGVDALELHYQVPVKGAWETRQPRPLADQARDTLTGLLGLNPVPYAPPEGVRVKPPVPRDAAPGFIVARTLEVNGRPVSFAFAGAPPVVDGAAIELTTALVKRSLNYRLALAGQAYPMFYDGLPLDARRALVSAVQRARGARRGLWQRDLTTRGAPAGDQAALEAQGVIFPKLFRRLAEFRALRPGAPLAEFPAWLTAEKPEAVLDVREIDFVDFGQLVRIQGERVQLTRRPEELVFISAR